MKNKGKNSIVSRGLKYKLRIALYLMSVLPLLVSIYLASSYIMPLLGFKFDIVFFLSISVFIAGMGFFVIKGVFDRILSVSSEAKLIAAGDINRELAIPSEDEIGDLGNSLNQLTQRIRSNMDELRSYSEKTSEINFEIQKRILVLSSLLQISSLISQGAKLDDILKLTVEKSRFIANSDVSYLFFKEEKGKNFYMRIAEGLDTQHLYNLKISSEAGLFERVIKTNRPLVLDKENNAAKSLLLQFQEQFKFNNTLALPVYLRGEVIAILGIGNKKEFFLFRRDDTELLDIFAKQVAIAVENDMLMHRIEKLEIKDTLTGLYNDTFIRNRLQEEIKRAIIYQRPCAFVLMNIDNFQSYHQNFGSLHAESALKKVAVLVRDSVTEIDRVGRVGDNEFAIVLPERNKRQAQTIAEEVRKKIEFSFKDEPPEKRLTASAGVSENPLDGVDAEELLAKAKEALVSVKKQGRNNFVN